MIEGINMISDKPNSMTETEKEIIVPEIAKSSKLNFENNFKKRKIICSVWLLGSNGNRDKFIGQKKVRVGKTDFVVRNMRYFINYDELKEDKKYYRYDCDVNNAIGSLSFHDISERKVSPVQHETMLRDGVVRVLMGKGGIPALYLLIAMIMTSVAIAGLMYFISQYQNQQKTIDTMKTQITTLQIENTNMKVQLGIIPAPEVK